jgi:hypothetical protein
MALLLCAQCTSHSGSHDLHAEGCHVYRPAHCVSCVAEVTRLNLPAYRVTNALYERLLCSFSPEGGVGLDSRPGVGNLFMLDGLINLAVIKQGRIQETSIRYT